MPEKRDLKHYDFARLARAKAVESWGRKSNSKKEVIEHLTTEEMSECALLELVRRMNQAIKAWANDKDLESEEKWDHDARPEWAVAFPDVEIGEILYSCDDLTEEMGIYVVVSKDREGFVRVVCTNARVENGKVYLGWADNDFSRSAEEVVKRAAENDLAYYEKRFRRAESVLDAIRNGKPFEHFLGEL